MGKIGTFLCIAALAAISALSGCVVVPAHGYGGHVWVPGYWASPHVWVEGHWRYR